MNATRIVSRIGSLALAALLVAGCGGSDPPDLLASAKEYLAKKDPKAAIIQLKSALQKDGQSGEARYLLGKAMLDTGDAAGAEAQLGKAEDLHYAPEQVAPARARALLQLGEYAKLTDAYAALKLQDKAAAADLGTSVAGAYLSRGQRDAAAQALDQALAAQPSYEPALLLQARIAAAKPDYPAALALVEKITAANPASAEAWMLQGQLQQFGQHDSNAALAAYQKALAQRNDLMGAHQAVVSLLLQAHDIDGATAHVQALAKALPHQPVTQFLQAQIAYLHGDFDSTAKLMQPLVQAAPNNPLFLQLAGAAAFRTNSMTQAKTLLAEAVKFSPGLPLATRLLAQASLRSGEPDRALEVLRPVLGDAAAAGEFYTLAGQAYLQKGDATQADEMFKRASRLRPDDPRPRTALALSEVARGQTSAGLGELETLSASDKGITADLALISAQLRRKDYGAALKAIDRLQAKQPKSPLAETLRANLFGLRGDRAGARAAFGRALAIDKDFFAAVAGLATLDLQDGKIDDARQRFRKLLEADPNNFRALLALAAIEKRPGGDPAEAEKLIRAAVKAAPAETAPRLQLIDHELGVGAPKAALSAAQDAVLAQPDNPEVLYALGRSQLANSSFEEAVTTFGKLEALQRSSPRAALGQAEAYRGLKNAASQERSLRHALEITPNLLLAQGALAGLMAEDGRVADALAVARTVQQQRPTEAVGYLLEGGIDARQRNWDGAIAAYRLAAQKQPESDAAARLHATLLAADRKDEAQRMAAAWRHDHPRDGAFAFYLGDRALAQKDWAGAEARYREVLQIQPENVPALNNVAWLLLQQSRPGALALAEKANALAPGQPALMDTLSMALAADNQVPKALELQKRVVAQAPDAPNFRLTLARLYLRAGDKGSAKTELDQLARLGSKFAHQDEVSQLLQGL